MRLSTIILSLSLILGFTACQQQSGNASNAFQQKEKVYQYALKNGDFYVATQAAYEILAIDEAEYSGWKDTLALLYFNRNLPAQALILSQEVLTNKPEDLRMLECSAISFQALGSVSESLGTYEKLYSKTGDIGQLYQIASLQYNLKRYGECQATLDKIAQDPKIKETKIPLLFNQTSQEVPLTAAIYNMHGVILKDTGNKEAALQAFQQALSVFPDFKLAQGNVESLK